MMTTEECRLMARQMLIDSYTGRGTETVNGAPLAWAPLHQAYQAELLAAQVDTARNVNTDDQVAVLTAVIDYQRRQFDALQRYEANKLLGMLTILTQVLPAFALACERTEIDVLLALPPLPEEIGRTTLE